MAKNNLCKKHLSLRDAAVVSGYTTAELKNFCKIGLIPYRKTKNRLMIRFDAFEKMNERSQTHASKPAKKPAVKAESKKRTGQKKATITDLVPFTAPNRQLLKVLEPVAFTAALAMTLHVAMIPAVASGVLFTINVSGATVEHMASEVEGLVVGSVAVPVALAVKVASIPALPPAENSSGYGGQVAGIATEAGQQATYDQHEVNAAIVKNVLIGIADAAESWEDMLVDLDGKTMEVLVGNITFDRLDMVVQSALRW